MPEQIARFYESAIEDGRVPVGDRLPPIREVASTCEVTRATVQEAYRRLAARGLVEGTVGRGTVVLASHSGNGSSNGHDPAGSGRLFALISSGLQRAISTGVDARVRAGDAMPAHASQ